MKKKILELLQTRFSGVDGKILEGIAGKLAETATSDEEAQTAVDGVTFSQVLQSYGDSRANQASETAVRNYEKKYNLKDGKSTVEPEPEPKPAEPEPTPKPAPKEPEPKPEPKPKSDTLSEEVSKALNEIIAANKALTGEVQSLKGELASMKTRTVTESRSARLAKAIEKLSAAQKSSYKYIDLSKMSDDEFEGFIDDTKGTVADLVKEAEAAKVGSRPQVGNIATNGKKATDAEIKSIVDAIAPSRTRPKENED